jgi:hypothetical protein
LGVPNKQEYLQNFALRVFKVADDADRSGVANKSTARNFLHASIFFEVLKQYGPLKEEVRGHFTQSISWSIPTDVLILQPQLA